jgi:hypothetical protein
MQLRVATMQLSGCKTLYIRIKAIQIHEILFFQSRATFLELRRTILVFLTSRRTYRILFKISHKKKQRISNNFA